MPPIRWAGAALTIVLAVALVLCSVAVLARLLLCTHDLGMACAVEQ